ncbi:hypothetical protein COV82_00065 [Candidatus Peregrinibacteria bacterium CG11_big_fil_rev_8_21_14_0_20_46_8]|nr:MAG: hypothetical protein COV82_00065 [Candidatus Peregrinibacteria bacterium CG11_big_fil_rev_8_21_14_0_20_46_8]
MDEPKAKNVQQWTAEPAGAIYAQSPRGTKEFFDQVEAERYRQQPWTRELIADLEPAGKRVLEVGTGLGTDHIQFARLGAIVSGIDLTPTSIEMTKKRMEMEGLHSDLHIADAEALPFEDNTFDIVYSFGVLHHTPDTQRAIHEICRVLKPGGTALITLYNRHSAFVARIWLPWFVQRMLGNPATWESRVQAIEEGGAEHAPLIKLYSKGEVESLFTQFTKFQHRREHLGLGNHGSKAEKLEKIFSKFPLMNSIYNAVGRYAGWYHIIHAAK